MTAASLPVTTVRLNLREIRAESELRQNCMTVHDCARLCMGQLVLDFSQLSSSTAQSHADGQSTDETNLST